MTDDTASASTEATIIGRKVLRPRQQVEKRIREAILTGELKGGEMLPPESELARQFNVSRTTLREALRALATQRLITKIPGARGGNLVQSVDHHSLGRVLIESMENLLALGSIEFEEVSQVRQYLEVPAVRLAAQHRTEEDLRLLGKIVDAQKAATISDPSVPELDAQFHSHIAQASGNRVLSSFVRALHKGSEPVHYLDLSPEVGRQTVRQHQAILTAIVERDPDAAEAAIVRHLTYLRENLLAHYAEKRGNPLVQRKAARSSSEP